MVLQPDSQARNMFSYRNNSSRPVRCCRTRPLSWTPCKEIQISFFQPAFVTCKNTSNQPQALSGLPFAACLTIFLCRCAPPPNKPSRRIPVPVMRDICLAVCSSCFSMSLSKLMSPLACKQGMLPDWRFMLIAMQLHSQLTLHVPAYYRSESSCLNHSSAHAKTVVAKESGGMLAITCAFSFASASCLRRAAASSSASLSLRITSSPSWSLTFCCLFALFSSARHLPTCGLRARRATANGTLHRAGTRSNACLLPAQQPIEDICFSMRHSSSISLLTLTFCIFLHTHRQCLQVSM